MKAFQNYDFSIFREDGKVQVFSGCIVRRFSAALFDACFLIGIFILIAIRLPADAEGTTTIPSFLAIGIPALCLFLPELLFRQTLGMLIFDIVVICPTTRMPWVSLLTRRFVNLVEVGTPSLVYHLVTACSRDNRSLSDMASGCFIVRKRFLLSVSETEPRPPSKPKAILIAVAFSILPVTLIAFGLLALVFGLFTLTDFRGVISLGG